MWGVYKCLLIKTGIISGIVRKYSSEQRKVTKLDKKPLFEWSVSDLSAAPTRLLVAAQESPVVQLSTLDKVQIKACLGSLGGRTHLIRLHRALLAAVAGILSGRIKARYSCERFLFKQTWGWSDFMLLKLSVVWGFKKQTAEIISYSDRI